MTRGDKREKETKKDKKLGNRPHKEKRRTTGRKKDEESENETF
jgi:hypothetical protein